MPGDRYPDRSARGMQPQIERAVRKRRARIPANTNSDPAQARQSEALQERFRRRKAQPTVRASEFLGQV
jgi:hypothetical protein